MLGLTNQWSRKVKPLTGTNTTTRIWRNYPYFVTGEYYQVSFQAKAINGFGGVNPFKVRLLNGVAITSLFGGTNLVPATNAYTAYVSEPFLATSTNLTLEFSDQGAVSSNKVSWIDAVAVTAITPITLTGGLEGSQFKLRFTGRSNLTYTVLASTNLTLPPTNWVNLGPAQQSSNNTYQHLSSPTSNFSRRYFRVRVN